jgi:hypothetical protein
MRVAKGAAGLRHTALFLFSNDQPTSPMPNAMQIHPNKSPMRS